MEPHLSWYITLSISFLSVGASAGAAAHYFRRAAFVARAAEGEQFHWYRRLYRLMAIASFTLLTAGVIAMA
jgi:hypothetical protein